MSDKRRAVPIEEAITRIGRKKHIHTFMDGGIALLGCDHGRADLIEAMRAKGVEEAGPQACAMGHTLAIRNYVQGASLFIEAKPRTLRSASKAKQAAPTAASEAQK